VHEVGLISAAIAHAIEVARQAGATRVDRLTFAVAPAGHVTREAVQTLVVALARGTLIEGAAVDVEVTGDRADGVEIALTSVDVYVPAADGASSATV
jgi:Zn finger protein HypA/HybF involved in hydrogenase expression